MTNNRRVLLFLPGEPARCPRGHKLPRDTWLIGDDVQAGQRCRWKDPTTRSECGSIGYFLVVPGGYRLMTEVSAAEIHAMENGRMTVRQVRDFLGLWFPTDRAA